jgi:hypothetical protein
MKEPQETNAHYFGSAIENAVSTRMRDNGRARSRVCARPVALATPWIL